MTRQKLAAGLLAAGVATAVGFNRARGNGHHMDQADHLRAYLADHLTGSDAAFAVVNRLRGSHAAPAEADLWERLHHEFIEERAIVRALLHSLGGSSLKMKRLIGQAAGSVLQPAAGGAPGSLALFRTLESLAVGVQGKRCLWRLARSLEPWLQPPTAKGFLELETQAVDQWEHIESRRLALASRTFTESGDRA